MTPTSNFDKKYHEVSTKSGWAAVLFSVPVLVVFVCFGRIDQGFGAWACAAILSLAAWHRWNLRAHFEFWIAIILGAAIQTLPIIYIPWGHKGLTGPALYPLAALDACIVFGLLKLADVIVKKKTATDVR